MPIPVSRTVTTTSPPRRSADSQIVPAPLGVLGAVGEQVAEHLRQPGQVGVQVDRLRRERDGEFVPGRLDGGAGRLHGAAHHVRQRARGTAAAPSCSG